ncbi:MAG: hypothetical protein COB53_09960 [Elusimicrobia bacterium]|nr:MAG: hypothetical protein COB53_09960 [Elusimicrobiota bacterium]
MRNRALLPILAAAAFSGCLYANVHVPRAYRSATPSDVKANSSDRLVSGRSCYQTLAFMFAWGDGGYSAAVADALSDQPDSILYDVNTDTHVRSYVLGLYSRVCTVVSGRVGSS